MSDVAVFEAEPESRAVAAQPPSLAMTMIERAITQGSDIAVIEKLMALQERYDAAQARKSFDTAMAQATSEIPVIKKNRRVQFEYRKAGAAATDYAYEDLGEIARTVKPILGRHGLSYRFRTTSNINEPVVVTCIISHRDGHFEENTLSAGRDDSGNKNSIQSIGSTSTYLQRMTLKAALGLAASEDDDGSESSQDPDDATPKKPRVPSPAEAEAQAANPVPAKPEFISPAGKGPGWCDEYIRAFSGATSIADLEEWDRLHDAILGEVQTKAPALYDKIGKAFEAKKETLSTRDHPNHGTDKYRPGDVVSAAPKDDPISTGPINVEKSAHPARAKKSTLPDVDKDYEGFLGMAINEFSKATDGGALETFWNNEIAPFERAIFPPDWNELSEAFGKRQNELKAEE